MANWRSYIDPSVGDGQNTIAGIIANGPTYGIGISDDLSVTGLSTFSDIARFSSTVRLDGELRDGDNAFGSSGQVLSSDGTDTKWVNAGSLSAGAASQVAINDDSNTNASRFLTFVDSSSGNNSVKTDPQLTYNPSTNVISTAGVDLSDNSKIRFGNGNDLRISHTSDLSSQNDSNGDSVLDGSTWASYIQEAGTGPLIFKSNGGPSTGAFQFYDTSWRPILKLFSGSQARAALYYAGSEKLITSSAGVTVTGTATATAFSGPLTGNVTGNLTGNADTATILATTRSIGGVNFNGSADINLPGVNVDGNQNTTGNAATATILETTRNFSITGEITANVQSFNGSDNLTLSATVDDNVIDEANLKVSNAPQNGFFLKCNTSAAGGLTWSEVTLPTANTLTGSTLSSGITATSITSLGNLTGLTVNGSSSVRDITIQAGYHLQRSNHHTGHLEGSYNNVGANDSKSNPIYSIGSSYNPTDSGLSDMYGIGYTHTNASFISFTGASGWGMYVAADGDARIYLGGSNGVISSTGQHYVGSNVVWNAGNDGSGSGLDSDTVDGIQASSFLRSDAEDSSSAPLNINGGTANGANDATLYVTATNNNDWGLLVNKNNSGSTEYGVDIRVGSSANYGLRVLGGGSEVFRVTGSGTVYANGNTVWHAGNDGSGSGLDADTLDGAQPNVSASNSTIVQRHSSGYIFSNYINTTDNSVSGSVSAIMVKQGDNYHRSANADAVRSFINVASGAAPANVQTFTSSGTWTKPSTGTIANVYMWGGGGGGGGNSNFNGGGGGGGYAEYNIPLSDLGSTVSVTVGGGGGVNNDGGTSQFGSTNYAAGGGETGHNGTNYETNGYGGSGGSPRGVGTGGNRGFYTSGTTDDGTSYYNNTGAESTEDGHSGGGGGSAAGGGPSGGGHAYMAGGGGGARRYGSTSSGGNSYGGGNGGSGNNNGAIPAGGGGARASGGRGLVRVVVV